MKVRRCRNSPELSAVPECRLTYCSPLLTGRHCASCNAVTHRTGRGCLPRNSDALTADRLHRHSACAARNPASNRTGLIRRHVLEHLVEQEQIDRPSHLTMQRRPEQTAPRSQICRSTLAGCCDADAGSGRTAADGRSLRDADSARLAGERPAARPDFPNGSDTDTSFPGVAHSHRARRPDALERVFGESR